MAYDTDLTSHTAWEAFGAMENLDVVSSIEHLKLKLEKEREMVFLLLSMRGGSVEYYKPRNASLVHHEYKVTVDGDKTAAKMLDGEEALCQLLNNYIDHYCIYHNAPEDNAEILAMISDRAPGTNPKNRSCDTFCGQNYSSWEVDWEGERLLIGYSSEEYEFFCLEGNDNVYQRNYILVIRA